MRDRIQSAAIACVARKGFSNTSMADIIAEAGLSAGAVYVYYRSKEDLVVDVGRRVFEDRMAMLDHLGYRDPVPHPSEAMAALMQSLTAGEYFPRIAVQVWGEAAVNEGLTVIARGILDQIGGHFEHYLTLWLMKERGQDAEGAAAQGRRLAPAVMGLIQGGAVQAALRGEGSFEPYVESVRALLAPL